jgi:hypothetical protein
MSRRLDLFNSWAFKCRSIAEILRLTLVSGMPSARDAADAHEDRFVGVSDHMKVEALPEKVTFVLECLVKTAFGKPSRALNVIDGRILIALSPEQVHSLFDNVVIIEFAGTGHLSQTLVLR